ncbi:lipopolysaccharide biosynthesis protein [Gordonia polyisoprenivorans]|uniref:lipopolysaccharide biosynthesis protein n=1 Tax=Gordonia polyisoprenivorans TaxID=84595 RepID=UPI0012DEE4F1
MNPEQSGVRTRDRTDVKRIISKLAGFSVAPALGYIAPFLALPLIARIGTTEDWTTLGVGQSVGLFASLLASYGWMIVGPVRIARAKPQTHRKIIKYSLWTRGIALAGTQPIILFALLLAVPHNTILLGYLAALSLALSGLSNAWYAVGTGNPRIIVTTEAIPKLIGTLLGATAVWATKSVIWYPCVIILFGALSVVVSTAYISGFAVTARGPRNRTRPRVLLRYLHTHLTPTLINLTGGTYSALLIPIAASVSPAQALIAMISIDKLFRVCRIAISTSTNALQRWVSTGRPSTVTPRMRKALVIHATLGILGGVLVATAGPLATEVMFGSKLRADHVTCILYGCALIALALNSSLGAHVMVPLGMAKQVLVSTVLGTLIGIPLLFSLAFKFGSQGAAAALAITEVLVTITQCKQISHLMKSGTPDNKESTYTEPITGAQK